MENLAKAVNVEMGKIEKVSFFGMVEIEDEDEEDSPLPEENNTQIGLSEEDPPAPPAPPVYLMEIYKLSGSLGVSLGSVGRPLEQDFKKCNTSRFFSFN